MFLRIRQAVLWCLCVAGVPVVGVSQAPTRVPSFTLVMQTYGCEPGKLTVPAGRIALVVHNRTRMETLQLQIERIGVGRVKESAGVKGRGRMTELLELAPGRYELKDPRAPYWKCEIEVTPGR
jgi:hypothetical protein